MGIRARDVRCFATGSEGSDPARTITTGCGLVSVNDDVCIETLRTNSPARGTPGACAWRPSTARYGVAPGALIGVPLSVLAVTKIDEKCSGWCDMTGTLQLSRQGAGCSWMSLSDSMGLSGGGHLGVAALSVPPLLLLVLDRRVLPAALEAGELGLSFCLLCPVRCQCGLLRPFTWPLPWASLACAAKLCAPSSAFWVANFLYGGVLPAGRALGDGLRSVGWAPDVGETLEDSPERVRCDPGTVPLPVKRACAGFSRPEPLDTLRSDSAVMSF